jgi:enoyl-CoA hydratase/carnithine racemase
LFEEIVMNLLIERHGRVALIRLNRPQARNALSTSLMQELLATLQSLDSDPQVGCFVITGRRTTSLRARIFVKCTTRVVLT